MVEPLGFYFFTMIYGFKIAIIKTIVPRGEYEPKFNFCKCFFKYGAYWNS